uniref:Uncharacterized protein n=1 Tax=Rhizophora mucronata TaxID=61149 RepID=A0A2P2PLD1_RHIMU
MPKLQALMLDGVHSEAKEKLHLVLNLLPFCWYFTGEFNFGVRITLTILKGGS